MNDALPTIETLKDQARRLRKSLGCRDHLTYAPARQILSLARREMRRSVRHFKHFATTPRDKMCLVPKGFARICP